MILSQSNSSDTGEETIWTIVIRRKGDWTLTQWDDGETLKRAWVLDSMIVERDGERALVDRAVEGPPYGPDWNELLTDLPMQLDRALKESNLWLPEDLEKKPNVARLVFLQVIRRSLAEISASLGGIE